MSVSAKWLLAKSKHACTQNSFLPLKQRCFRALVVLCSTVGMLVSVLMLKQ